MLSTLRLPAREASATDVAARATDAAMVAAQAAIRAADAAIKAAEAAVRLIDEHEGEVIVLQPAPTQQPGRRSEPELIASLPAGGPFGEAAPLARPFGEGARQRRPGRGTRALAAVLIVLGTLALADVAVTLVWQEPISAVYAKLRQDHLSGALRKVERALPTPAERRALAGLTSEPARIAFLASALERRARDGSPVGRIRIPRIGISFVVVSGTGTSALESGPGIYPQTVFPGLGGTTAIAGHRTTYLAPFRHIDALRPGSRIMLDMPYARFTYAVTSSAVVAPTDVRAAVSYAGYPRLVLSACTPVFSAAKRLLVFARLQSSTLRQGGTPPPRLTSGARTPAARPAVRARPAA